MVLIHWLLQQIHSFTGSSLGSIIYASAWLSLNVKSVERSLAGALSPRLT